ncbi:MAG: tetraacyldisaccharide 4'-kinase [Granulosicoccus sp.]
MSRIELAWRRRGCLAAGLWPLSLLYRLIITCRRFAYRRGWLSTRVASLPVVVVGNISVGGTGKSPLCAYLVSHFKAAGWRPAIVSRGYGGERHLTPHLVDDSDSPVLVGDEPLMLFRQTGVPVCVCVKRALAVDHIAAHTDTDIVFSDDGLQHLAMQRVAEIVVLDGKRGLGNGWLLPAGPVRESAKRLEHADLIAVQGSDQLHHSLLALAGSFVYQNIESNHFQLDLIDAIALSGGKVRSLSSFTGGQVIAMAGIGHPQRFFDALKQTGLQVTGISKPDHHDYSLDDFDLAPGLPVLVTAKDAVKLKCLGELPVDVYEVRTRVTVSEPLRTGIDRLERALHEFRSINHAS